MNKSPFIDSKEHKKKAKILLYGGYGTGKTWLSLHFPRPVIIDMERGSELYAGKFDFRVFHTTQPDRVQQGIAWLKGNKHDRQSIILDSMSEYWSALQAKWTDIFLRKNPGAGNKGEFYDVQPHDWIHVKGEFRDFLRSLLMLDMHVICTCRVKDVYAKGTLMKKIGEAPDSERNLPYLFDTVVRLERDDTGRYIGRVEKDRTQSLPPTFEASYSVFAKAFELEMPYTEQAQYGLPSSLPDMSEDAWIGKLVDNRYLPVSLRDKDITFFALASDKSISWKSQQGQEYGGRQLIHMWESGKDSKIAEVAAELLRLYPSQKQAKQEDKTESENAGEQKEPEPDPTPAPIGLPDITVGGWENETVADVWLPDGYKGQTLTYRTIATEKRGLLGWWKKGKNQAIAEIADMLMALFPEEQA